VIRERITLLPKQAELLQAREFEVLLSGAFAAGKTRAGCYKLREWSHTPGARIGVCRKTLNSLRQTTLYTLLKPRAPLPPVLPDGTYEHNKSDRTIYVRGGGEIHYFGFDHPETLGSLEFDAVLVDEGIELDEPEYTMLIGRVRGDALGYRQIATVTNPGPPSHFLHRLFYEEHDPQRRLIETNSLENPFLPPDYVERLKALKGTDYQRYVLGKWVGYEGLVYQHWQRELHAVHRGGPWTYVIAGIDEGVTNPAVLLIVGVDEDERLHVVREFYERGVLPDRFVEIVHGDWVRTGFRTAYVPPECAGLRAALRKAGVPVTKANHAVFDGIRSVQAALDVGLDGRPRLTVEPSCTQTIREIEGYCWKQGKDEPVKEHDHAMDALRYVVHTRASRPSLVGCY
jgi:phage terminase large subunit